MVEPAAVRRIALSFPETVESSHHGTPDFRVRKKIFATLPPEKGRVVLKLPVEMHGSLVGGNPDVFSTNAWSKQGWIELDLARVADQELEALLEEAWKNVAPKTLVKSRDELR